MKKYFYFLFVVCLAILSSCEGRDGRNGRDGIDGVITNRQVIDCDAYADNWVYSNGAYYASFDIPELTADAYDNAVVLCYAEFNTGTENAYQEMLPFTYFDTATDSTIGEVFYWSRLLDFDYTVGSFTVYYTTNDFTYSDEEPGHWHFRLVLLW